MLQLCGQDLMVWSGIELLCLPLLALGGAGFVSATANIAPVAQRPACTRPGSPATSSGPGSIHYGLHPLVDLLFVETNPAPGKWVLEQRGLIASGHVRPPLITPTDAGLVRIKQLLAEGERYLSPADGFTAESEAADE